MSRSLTRHKQGRRDREGDVKVKAECRYMYIKLRKAKDFGTHQKLVVLNHLVCGHVL